jgi:AcrR family transcriptional regulator
MKAGVNVAAVNYHFRDKAGLYAEVLQYSMRAAQLEAIRHTLRQDLPPEEILRAVIKLRLQGVSRGVSGWHFRIMAREMAQPTPAMSNIVKRVSVPTYRRMLEVVGSMLGLSPEDETTRLCAHSILGQIFIYVAASPLLLQLWPELKMTPERLERIADHIADFSLAYLRQFRANHGRQKVTSPRSTRREKE